MRHADTDIPAVMTGVQLVGHGGTDKLVYRTDIPTPVPGREEVLIRVAAAAVNNTDVNTRIGWYSKSVTGATSDLVGQGATEDGEDASWSGVPLHFPRIQGADACGVAPCPGHLEVRPMGPPAVTAVLTA